MNAHDFILKQVRENLISQGFSHEVSEQAAGDALDWYKSNSHFRRGAINETVAFAKKRAKARAKL